MSKDAFRIHNITLLGKSENQLNCKITASAQRNTITVTGVTCMKYNILVGILQIHKHSN